MGNTVSGEENGEGGTGTTIATVQRSSNGGAPQLNGTTTMPSAMAFKQPVEVPPLLTSSFSTTGQFDKSKFKSFPGSAFLEKTFCGSIDTTDPAEYEDTDLAGRLLKRADVMCLSSPNDRSNTATQFDDGDHEYLDTPQSILSGTRHSLHHAFGGEDSSGLPQHHHNHRPVHPSSAMLARALVSEVTDNPKTMKPSEMAAREKRLLKAQEAAAKRFLDSQQQGNNGGLYSSSGAGGATANGGAKPVGAPGGVGPPNVVSSIAFACTGDDQYAAAAAQGNLCVVPGATTTTTTGANTALGGRISEGTSALVQERPLGPYAITIGLSLSRRHAAGHPDTVTRQTAFDLNELQDRTYKYVSSTDAFGWRAGGGEPRGVSHHVSSGDDMVGTLQNPPGGGLQSPTQHYTAQAGMEQRSEKIALPDTVHIPIIDIDCPNAETVDQVIQALAAGEIFIPHMSVLPEALSVQGQSPPDLVLRFGCERNDDIPPDDWPNWCLEFMHNQLYEYFYNAGARWKARPFTVTLARKVRWKTVKHMNKYFSNAERVIEGWREQGPRTLQPQVSYIEGGASPEEVARPYGIYLMRRHPQPNGGGFAMVPTNYFAPNFDPPYTTKMTRSLLINVLDKSWDKKRREWTSIPMPRVVSPGTLLQVAMGCTDPNAGGFMAKEVTNVVVANNNSSHNNNSSTHHFLTKSQQQQHSVATTAVAPARSSSNSVRTQNSGTNNSISSTNINNHHHSEQYSRKMVSPVESPRQQKDPHQSSSTAQTEKLKEVKFARSENVAEEDRARHSEVHAHRLHSDNDDDDDDEVEDTDERYQPRRDEASPKLGRRGQGPVDVDTVDDGDDNDDDDNDDNDEFFKPAQASPYSRSNLGSTRYSSSLPHFDGDDHTAEEKKMDDAGGGANDMNVSLAASVLNMSVAASGTTTVIHTNTTASMSRSYSHDDEDDEDGNEGYWAAQQQSIKATPDEPVVHRSNDPPGAKVKSALVSSRLKKKKENDPIKSAQEELEKERERHSAMISKAQKATEEPSGEAPKRLRNHARAQLLRDREKGRGTFASKAGSPRSRRSPPVERNNSSVSGFSLEYSPDGSSAMLTSESPFGVNFAGDDSTLMTDTDSKFPQTKTTISAPATTSKDDDDVESSVLSIQESTSSAISIVPTDEELFAIGWAKALDASSGNYYYFTLDRTKTVWDNPLTH